MKKEFIQKQKDRLEKNKKALEEELNSFAKKNPNVKGDWESKFPGFSTSEIGSSRLEVSQDEIEEYLTRLPVEHSLEFRLQDVNLALKKIKLDEYGKCEKCGKMIGIKRLEVCPEARFCMSCEKDNR